jgi:hypothetical protein
LMINDPELIKHVLVSDFKHFHDRGFYYDEENDPLSGKMFVLVCCIGTWYHNEVFFCLQDICSC